MTASLIDEIIRKLSELPPEKQREAQAQAFAATGEFSKWAPTVGPQRDAYYSKADILLYGGAGGGGKSDLGLGLAFTAHRRSLVLRRTYTDLSGLLDRAIAIHGTHEGVNKSPPPSIKTEDGRLIRFAGCQHPGDEQSWQGHPFDYKFFDEAVQFLESQVRFHLGWVRTTDPNQRTRVVFASNPPMDARGDWIIRMFRPWLDITHPKPARPGELRWFITAPDGSDIEVDGPEPVEMDGDVFSPMSRTFIPAAFRDNPYLIDTGYKASLDAMPEPLRSAVRDGNFMAARQDDEWQVIPAKWVIEAQSRWTPDGWRAGPMTMIGLDIGAGRDETVIAARHGVWFAPLETVSGEKAKDPAHAAQLAIKVRRDECPIVVDVGGGYGGASITLFRENGIPCRPFNAANRSINRSKDGKLQFYNKRAEAWWKMREALDPNQQGGSLIALPPDPQLLADLTAPRWESTTRGIKVEGKEDIKKRIGRSTDRGDAVIMALSEGEILASQYASKASGFRRSLPRVILARGPRLLRRK